MTDPARSGSTGIPDPSRDDAYEILAPARSEVAGLIDELRETATNDEGQEWWASALLCRAATALAAKPTPDVIERLVESLESAVQDAHCYGLIRDHWRRDDSVLGVWQECPAVVCSEARKAIKEARQ